MDAEKHKAPTSTYHVPVMFSECMEALAVQSDGRYVDCTLGGAGHTRGILERLGPRGRLIAFDQDADAARNLPQDDRIIFVPENFKHLYRFLRVYDALPVDGLLADLGVSSHQFDQPERGFSFRADAPLDMRMDCRQPLTAAGLLQQAGERELQDWLSRYGEVTNAKTLAQALVERGRVNPVTTINDLLQVLAPLSKGNPQRYYAQVFQALRIAVNDELGALEQLLRQLPDVMKPGGRVVIITFHSLEDRLVKHFFKTGGVGESNDLLYGKRKPNPFRLLHKKPIEPSADEIKRNGRARSARLRVAEYLG